MDVLNRDAPTASAPDAINIEIIHNLVQLSTEGAASLCSFPTDVCGEGNR